jgi:hypothetical protein
MVLSFLSGSVLTALSLVRSDAIRMADFSADRFGFPYWWVEHVSVTFAGPADYWSTEPASFARNLASYFLLAFGFWAVIFLIKKRKTNAMSAKKMMG